MTKPRVKFQGKTLIIGNTIRVFESNIGEIAETDHGVLVRLKLEEGTPDRNIFLVGENGQIKWRIKDLGIKAEFHPYEGFSLMEDGSVEVGSSGYRCKLNMETGDVKVIYFHPHG